MDGNFKKFKKRILAELLIKCAVIGLTAAMIVVIAVLLPCKLCGVNLLWIYYVLIASGGFALGGGIAFLLLRTNDKNLVKRLDADLKLEERVQTAYEYSGSTGEIYDMLRDDTSAALGRASVKALPFKNILATVLCGVLALSCTIAVPVIAACVPAVFAQAQGNGDGEKEDPPRPVTDWEWEALDELITYVENSRKADSYAKAGMLAELKGLRNVLSEGVSQSGLGGFVRNTVSRIRNAVSDANARNGVTEEQQALNSAEEKYVVEKLYEIFSLPKPDDENSGNNQGEEENPDQPSNPGGNGGVNMSDVPFFDPEKGYVTVGDVRDEYYERVQQALAEGTISKEEWEYIMATYFADLSNKEE